MVDFTIVSSKGDEVEMSGRPCFGDLNDAEEAFRWKGKPLDGAPISYVKYETGDNNRFPRRGYGFNTFKWAQEHPIFGKCLISDEDGYVTVGADAPADAMLGTLSLARSFGKQGFKGYVRDLYGIFKNKDWAVYLAEIVRCRDGYLIGVEPYWRYREESIICPFTIKRLIDWIKDPIAEGGGGIEDVYSTSYTYDSVKTAIIPEAEDYWEDIVCDEDGHPSRTCQISNLLQWLDYEGVIPHG